MIPNRIESNIDEKINLFLSQGKSYSYIIENLKENINKFKKREGFIRVSKKYLLNNWKQIPLKNKYTTYYIIHSTKRLQDIEWIIKKSRKISKL